MSDRAYKLKHRPVAISLRLYRALARAFPYEFKAPTVTNCFK